MRRAVIVVIVAVAVVSFVIVPVFVVVSVVGEIARRSLDRHNSQPLRLQPILEVQKILPLGAEPAKSACEMPP